jgi:type I restriction enzyme R subunit
LIQKFNQKVREGDAWSERNDVIVITDEAHRTQYGTLSLNLRNALPKASYIGFTGTPLFKDDEITRRVFGEYISTYDFQRAVEDSATVPLYYDARGEELHFVAEDGSEYSVSDPKGLNEKIAEKLEAFETDDIDVQQRLERELKRDYHIITSTSRLEQIAEDFVQHYANGWESGKAMLVCIDKITCVRMHQLIEKKWTDYQYILKKNFKKAIDEQDLIQRENQVRWMEETQFAVVVSEEQGEVDRFRKWDLDITPHRRLIKEGFIQEDGSRLDMENAFKKEEHPFRVAIVCAMWLTGFDVPTLSTLYLDKPLKAHTLMQAIARANRVAEGKNNGLIVDYCGILKNLRTALATFAGRGDEGHDDTEGENEPAEPKENLLKGLREAIDLVGQFLDKKGFKLESIISTTGFERNAAIIAAKEFVNENDQTRKRFEVMCREVFKKFKACINIPGINELRDSRDAIDIIYKSLQKDREKADISDIILELHQIVDGAIQSKEGSVFDPEVTYHTDADKKRLYDISKIDFERLRQEFTKSDRKNTTVQSLKSCIEKRLGKLLMQNPLRTDFQEHYEKLVKEYNKEKDRLTIEQTFEALLKLIEDLGNEETRAMREGLDEESLALFDLLKKPELSSKEIKQIKKVAEGLLRTLKSERLKVSHWREKEATRDAVKQQIYDFLYDENTGLPVDDYQDDEITALTEQVFWHVYRVYPTVPSPYYSAA